MRHDDTGTIELDLTKASKLSFRLDVSGASEAPSGARLVCESDGLEYGFPCRIDESLLEANVPSMEGKIAPGTYSARLEVVVEGMRFVPIETTLEFKAPVRVAVVERKAPVSVAKSVTLRARYAPNGSASTEAKTLGDALKRIVSEISSESKPKR